MSELILHHYPTSLFAEKARLMLGFKGLSWRSVTIPSIMPKPDLTALTGGYRRTPVLQIGADIYCDTALMARRLEQEKASPTFYPEGQEFTVASLAAWGDSVLFMHAVSLVFQPESLAVRFAKVPPEAAKAFVADRSSLFTGGSATRLSAEQAKHQWPTLMARLELQLSRNGDFLFGEPSIADFSVAHTLWFLRQTPVTAPFVDNYPGVSAWLGRVLGFGHGAHSDLTSAEAIEIARNATPAALPDEAFVDPNGFKAGDQVAISATDYGVDSVEGELVFAGTEELILRREDDRAGVVHVHFPRLGFKIEKR
ncbi:MULTISPECIES: glutathione S-transferase family protein [Pseudomonas syringae group]|uniref:Glutathione S-transferase n=1 Tax=Pseudomonas syringae pv. primulae TaxID=251707 RepID=A0A0P9YRV3_9PSED|nr:MULTISPECIES: glutathione S-transferase family protein [Pseudomonas syringae group]KPY37014.1 Glutathione S-transferase [Pseudomonas syringae pv. primulae]MBD8189112.1 glutathione S-transferase family protein [Pseudomonas viridiflava]MBD8200055.1 glutathione S-transferase family protein [Pseudomonas viridiflava]TKJ68241.1 glutathione S-transferase family protein [Pseudomonas viridiflava]TKK24541.1 glutathione S-transferase family protein [Pseudomonas viridiflava]